VNIIVQQTVGHCWVSEIRSSWWI